MEEIEPSNQSRTDFFKENKSWMIGAGVLFLAIALIALGARELSLEPVSLVEGCNPGDRFSQTTGEPCLEIDFESCGDGEVYDKNTGEPCVGVEDPEATPTTGAASYLAALEKYAEQSVLFDGNCRPSVERLAVPTGTRVLIANNSRTTLAVGVETKKANLLPFYYILSSSLAAPGEFPVSCNGEPRATIIAR